MGCCVAFVDWLVHKGSVPYFEFPAHFFFSCLPVGVSVVTLSVADGTVVVVGGKRCGGGCPVRAWGTAVLLSIEFLEREKNKSFGYS